jgi:predicted NBD/HSP70 family sugar kinase
MTPTYPSRPRVPLPHRPRRNDETAGEISAAMLAAIASGTASNRAALARQLGYAPSTVTAKVQDLIATGILREAGVGKPTGGRRARELQLIPGAGRIIALAIGRRHTRVGVLDLMGALHHAEDLSITIAPSAEEMLERIFEIWTPPRELEALGPLRGIGLTVPGPVNVARGWVDSSASMPGWHRFPVAQWSASRFGVPTVIENDANATALGECTLRVGMGENGWPPRSLLVLKAGSAVGCGLMLNGHLHRGSTALAGDIAHIRVAAAGDNLCACGNRGCLDTVVGGAMIAADLRRAGVPAEGSTDVVQLVLDGNPRAATLVRAAGRLIGITLSAIVNFVNPDVVVIGGKLSTSEAFVAAIRSQLYENCHPLATHVLSIEPCVAGGNSELLGVAQLVLRHALVS